MVRFADTVFSRIQQGYAQRNTMTNSDTESVNHDFYEHIYRRRNFLLENLLPYISYDQLSKAKRNIRLLGSHGTHSKHEEVAVLDYGCGRGLFLRKLAYRPLRAYGLDISPAALTRLKNLDWGKHRDFEPVEIKDFLEDKFQNHFDIVNASHILEHVADDKLVASKLVESVRPGGLLMINVPINEVVDDPNHVRAYSKDSIRQLFSDAPLTILELVEQDRFTGFILYHEIVKRGGKIKTLLLRTLRATLALLPLSMVEHLETLLPPSYPNQQAIFVARKDPG
jgi:2-polyprenyl-3-methyl-5-hydroxy-6-metoxy-1,4-benzoquinol methylase